MVVVRGICASPISSEDEAEQQPQQQQKKKTGKTQQQQKKKKNLVKLPKKQHKKVASSAFAFNEPSELHLLAPKSASSKELICTASDLWIAYLAEQLDVKQQVRLCEEFGYGQGYMVRAPTIWKKTQERADFAKWIRALGFTSHVLHNKHLFRIASLKAEIILRELQRRVQPTLTHGDAIEEDAMDIDDDAATSDAKAMAEPIEDIENDPRILSVKKQFEALDAQRLEILTLSEHNRILSSNRHMQIADAMEEVLAKPSLRKDRSRARRLSKLGRISGRRISVVPIRPSVGLPLVEEDSEWDEEMEDAAMELPTRVTMTPVKNRNRRISLSEPMSATKVKKKNILGEAVLQLVLHSGMIATTTLKDVIRNVSTMWRKIAVVAYAWRVADYTSYPNVRSMAQVFIDHPRGHYLSDGAYKVVYKVFSTRHMRLEAVSVMDIGAIEGTGNQNVVRQELAHSVLLSNLVERRFCPNFLEIYDIFLTHEKPHPDRWGSATCRKPVELLTDSRLSVDPMTLSVQPQTTSTEGQRMFQYIQMEFCDGGDVEDFISLQEDKLLPLESVAVPFFFQMVFSLYCARERYHLRHCDIKLLNFFLKDVNRIGLNKLEGDDTVLLYYFEKRRFELRLPEAFSYWVKLADYGTADSNLDNLGKPVSLDQFTTLENTPIEFLLAGDAAKQSFAADTFSLGLCFLHLFTGNAPYEEILEEVRCPPALLKDLKYIWASPRKNSGYTVVKRVAQDDADNVLYHTLYRFLVLFGLPEENPCPEQDKVWQVLMKHLRPDAAATTGKYMRSSRNASAMKATQEQSVKNQFHHDCQLFSVAEGSHPIIQLGRQRLEALPGALDMLTRLVDFNPLRRPTLKQVLSHSLFASLEVSEDSMRSRPDYVVDSYKIDPLSSHSFLDV